MHTLQFTFSFGWITIWFIITLSIIQTWASQNYDCFFFAVELCVFLEVSNWFVFVCLVFLCTDYSFIHSFRELENLCQMCSSTPKFCHFCWLSCELATSLYHFYGHFLPLSFVSPSHHIFLFWGLLLAASSSLVTESMGSGAHLPGFKVWQITGCVTWRENNHLTT